MRHFEARNERKIPPDTVFMAFKLLILNRESPVLYFSMKKYNGGGVVAVVTVSQKGWIVIPSELRAKYRWNTGDRVQVVDYGGVVSLVPILRNPDDEGMGAIKVKGRSLLRARKRMQTEEKRRERVRK